MITLATAREIDAIAKNQSQKPIYQVMVDHASGLHKINTWESQEDYNKNGYQSEGHYNEIDAFDSKEAADKTIEELKGPAIFAVFSDTASGETFISQEHELSGNWRGSKYDPAMCISEFDTMEKAEKFLAHPDQKEPEENGMKDIRTTIKTSIHSKTGTKYDQIRFYTGIDIEFYTVYRIVEKAKNEGIILGFEHPKQNGGGNRRFKIISSGTAFYEECVQTKTKKTIETVKTIIFNEIIKKISGVKVLFADIDIEKYQKKALHPDKLISCVIEYPDTEDGQPGFIRIIQSCNNVFERHLKRAIDEDDICILSVLPYNDYYAPAGGKS